MKKIKSIILSATTFMLVALTITSCTDKNDWDVDSSHERLFSISKMSVAASITDVEYTFTGIPGAEYYIIELSKDSLYDAIEMGQHESSIVYGEDKSITKSPVTLGGLKGDSKYFLRVKAMSSIVTSSNWSYLTDYSFKTRAEQIITGITVSATDVTITWPAGQTATHVTVSNGTDVITKDLTADNIAAGEVTVTGLESETEYTIKLINGSDTRGSKSFTTLMDLNGAKAINPGDDIADILANAEEGDAYAVMPGTYDVNQKITLTKNLVLRGAVPGEATINGMSFELKAGVGFELKDLVLNGKDASGQLINYLEDHKTATTEALVISGCNVSNYSSGLINQRKKVEISSITITNNIFNNIGSRLIDMQAGYAKVITLTKNTIANSGTSDSVIRIDNKATDFTNVSSEISIINNTFYKVSESGKGFLYVRLSGNEITFNKNLIVESNSSYSNEATTNVIEMTKNYYHKANDLFTSSTKRVYDANPTKEDPQFTDVEKLDFTVQNNAVISAGVGDPRWLP